MPVDLFPFPALNKIDGLAQSYVRAEQYGNPGNWRLSWVGGLNGVCGRIVAADRSFRLLTEWLPGLPLWNWDCEIAVCLFALDSALECWVFALNALGFAVRPQSFHDIESASALRKISPENIVGTTARRVRGYDELFPSMSALWRSSADDIRLVMDNHDVSKHRVQSFWGATLRQDPPPELLKSLRMGPDGRVPFHRTPLSSISLPKDPRLPSTQLPPELEHWVDFVPLKGRFDTLIARSFECAYDDLRLTVPLKTIATGS